MLTNDMDSEQQQAADVVSAALRAYEAGKYRLTEQLLTLALEDRHYDLAVDYFTRAIEAEPTLSIAFSSRARAHAALGNVEEGSADMRKAHLLTETGLDTSRRTLAG